MTVEHEFHVMASEGSSRNHEWCCRGGYQLVDNSVEHHCLANGGADWRSGKRRGLGTKGSLVRDLAAAQFVVALSKSHLPTA